ncbi:molybdate ABC transporter substrate-binding protein [bacterium]|nr:molybdate ABC transporter substrate-binding protein [bacterium]MBU1502318.1 molybdate ABC transporter substrate-binding protein [bacterium]
MKRCFSAFLFILFASVVSANQVGVLSKSPAIIFASGNNKFVFPVLMERFYMKHPEAKLIVKYGATGDLAADIFEGASYDLFLAADMEHPQMIFKSAKAAAMPREYARGVLILFVPADKTLHQRKLEILKDKKIKNITIANHQTAPYGKASIETLQNSNLFEAVASKIRYSSDISTVITNVVWYDDAGFLSKSALHSLPAGYKVEGVNWIEIDPSLYAPIRQGLVMSHTGVKNSNAVKFVDFIFSEEGKAIYKEYGYK